MTKKEKAKKREIRIGYARVSKSDGSQNESLNEQIKLLENNNCEFVFYEKIAEEMIAEKNSKKQLAKRKSYQRITM